MTRDEKGRFPKGVSGNPQGRPAREIEKDYLSRLRSRVSPADWDEIVDKAIAGAKRGDPSDRKFLADYLIGVPVQRNEHTGEDGGPIRIIVEYVNDPAAPA